MAGRTYFFHNGLNAVRTATAVASSVRTASNNVFPRTPTRTGNGTARLIGDYTAQEYALFEVEIETDTAVTKTISGSTFQGVGNGVISGIAATGLDPQTITVELYNLGQAVVAAKLGLYNVTLRHSSPGTAGNATRISVDISGLVYTDTEYSLVQTLAAGTKEVQGSQFDWGALPLDENGMLDPATVRFQIGNDPQIYRVSKKYTNGVETFLFTPNIVRQLPAGNKVKSVTGTYAATITDGVNPDETHTGITTIFDFLNSLILNSTIIVVDGVVSYDLAPGGMATLDLPLRTTPYVVNVSGDGSAYVTGITETDLGITLGQDSPTETLTIECVDNAIVTHEEWIVAGAVSGERAIRAVTGEAYDDPQDLVAFTIPPKEMPDEEQKFRFVRFDWVARGVGEYQPPICVSMLTLGKAAVSKTLTLEYKAKPNVPPNCGCENRAIEGEVNPYWLGLNSSDTPEGGGSIVDQIEKEHLDMLYSWAETAIAANTSIINVTPHGEIPRDPFIYYFTALLTYDRVDIYVIQRICDIFHDTLTKIAPLASNVAPAWQATHDYVAGDLIQPTVANDHYYRCVADGQSDVAEPVWGMSWGTDADGTTSWQDMGVKPIVMWKTYFDAMVITVDPFASSLEGGAFWKDAGVINQFTTPWQAAHAYTENDRVIPTWYNGFYYICTSNGVSGATEPLWPLTAGSTVTDGMAVWKCYFINMKDDVLTFRVTEGDANGRIGYFLKQWETQMARVQAAGELDPSPFFEANTSLSSNYALDTSSCWQDRDVSYYWEINDGEFLPAFTDVIYHSAKSRFNSETNELEVYSAREFALAISVECPQYLKEGDKIILQIVVDQKTYELGDVISIPVISGRSLPLTGGLNGTSDITWRVNGTVDGPFADYVLNTLIPAPYSDGGLDFLITPGAIAFSLGDIYTFSIEAGTFKWRKNGGAWNTGIDIDTAPAGVLLADGLSALFLPGATPSFVIADDYQFDVLQPYSPNNVKYPSPDTLDWQYSGASATLTCNLGGLQTITTICLIHDLPAGSGITVQGSDDNFATVKWTETLTWRSLIITHFPTASPARTAIYLRLNLTTATAGRVFYFGAGQAVNISQPCRECVLTHSYRMQKGTLSSRYLAKTTGGAIEWGNFLVTADAAAVVAMMDWTKAADDEPVVFIPHYLHPEYSRVVRLTDDLLEVVDRYQYHPDTEHETHRHGVKRLNFTGVNYGV